MPCISKSIQGVQMFCRPQGSMNSIHVQTEISFHYTQCLYIIMLHSASSCELWSIFTKLRADKMWNQRKSEKISFVTIKVSTGYRVTCKRCPFALQNMPFCTSKDTLLQCKRASFRRQKGVDWKAEGKEFDKERAEHAQKRQPKYQREERPPQAPPAEGMLDRIQWFVVGVWVLRVVKGDKVYIIRYIS